MAFAFTIKANYKNFHLTWELIHKDQRVERYRVQPVSNPDKYILLENNRPLISGKYKLKNRRVDWQLVGGQNMGPSNIEKIIEVIESQVTREMLTANDQIMRNKKKKKDVPEYIRNRTLQDRIQLNGDEADFKI